MCRESLCGFGALFLNVILIFIMRVLVRVERLYGNFMRFPIRQEISSVLIDLCTNFPHDCFVCVCALVILITHSVL